jgi:hypothetical protein
MPSNRRVDVKRRLGAAGRFVPLTPVLGRLLGSHREFSSGLLGEVASSSHAPPPLIASRPEPVQTCHPKVVWSDLAARPEVRHGSCSERCCRSI